MAYFDQKGRGKGEGRKAKGEGRKGERLKVKDEGLRGTSGTRFRFHEEVLLVLVKTTIIQDR